MVRQIFTFASIALRLLFVVLVFYQIWQQDWTGAFVMSQAILISFLPNILWRVYQIKTPFSLRVGIVFFMSGSLVLGEMADFYNVFWWWDLVLHFVAGVGITLIGFISLLVTFREIEIRATPFFTSLLAFSFSLAAAVLWEIYEFLIDQLLLTDSPMQPSNEDTMTDLIIAVLGSLLVTVFGYRYFRWQKREVLSGVIEDGAKANK